MTGRHGTDNSREARTFQPRDARGVAFAVLNHYRETGEFVAPLLDRNCTQARLSPQDRGLAGELVHGVVRRQATLDSLIAPCVSRPRIRVEPELWTLLQLGAYQLVLTSSIPAHAAVNETVKLAAQCGNPRWTAMLNGVLRAVGRSVTSESVNEPAADAVPLTDGDYRRLAQPVFPDPAADFAGYVAQAGSYPAWLIDRWTTRFDRDSLLQLAFWFNAPGPSYVRVNRLRAERQQVLDELHAARIDASPGEIEESIRLEQRARIASLVEQASSLASSAEQDMEGNRQEHKRGRLCYGVSDGLAEGLFSLQDESAMWAVDLLDPQPGETILDLCAAPGTKTSHVAERMQNEGRVVATDVASDRLLRVEENCDRLGISIVERCLIRRDGSDIPQGPFDAVLVDAPCSNTGVLGKRAEARWRLGLQDLDELPALQLQLLQSALVRLKPSGRLVYSTCSIEPEENRGVTLEFVERNPSVRLAEERTHRPGRPADGGYQALFRRA